MIRRLLENWPLKLFSLLVAVSVWFFVVTTAKDRAVVTAPVDYLGLEDDLVISGPRPHTIEVEIDAFRWVMRRATPETVRARVDLRGVREGDNVVYVSPTEIETPPGVTIVRLTPSRVHVAVVAATRRTVRVAADVRGEPAQGHRVHRVTLQPPAVQIKGPRSTIERRDVVPTTPVDVSGGRTTLTRTVALALPDSVEATGDPTVQVTVEIRPEDSMSTKETRR
jgi:YbbR domain-containing protein